MIPFEILPGCVDEGDLPSEVVADLGNFWRRVGKLLHDGSDLQSSAVFSKVGHDHRNLQRLLVEVSRNKNEYAAEPCVRQHPSPPPADKAIECVWWHRDVNLMLVPSSVGLHLGLTENASDRLVMRTVVCLAKHFREPVADLVSGAVDSALRAKNIKLGTWTLLVEGDVDKDLLELAMARCCPKFFARLAVVPMHGASKLREYFPDLLQTLSKVGTFYPAQTESTRLFVLFDGDQMGFEKFKGTRRVWLKSYQTQTHCPFVGGYSLIDSDSPRVRDGNLGRGRDLSLDLEHLLSERAWENLESAGLTERKGNRMKLRDSAKLPKEGALPLESPFIAAARTFPPSDFLGVARLLGKVVNALEHKDEDIWKVPPE